MSLSYIIVFIWNITVRGKTVKKDSAILLAKGDWYKLNTYTIHTYIIDIIIIYIHTYIFKYFIFNTFYPIIYVDI